MIKALASRRPTERSTPFAFPAGRSSWRSQSTSVSSRGARGAPFTRRAKAELEATGTKTKLRVLHTE